MHTFYGRYETKQGQTNEVSSVMTGSLGLSIQDDSLSNGNLVGESAVRGPSWAKMPLLTISMLGLQIVWSMEMAWGQ